MHEPEMGGEISNDIKAALLINRAFAFKAAMERTAVVQVAANKPRVFRSAFRRILFEMTTANDLHEQVKLYVPEGYYDPTVVSDSLGDHLGQDGL